MVSFGSNKSGGQSYNESRSMSGDLTGLRNLINNQFIRGIRDNGGLESWGNTPQGPLRSIFQNLYGDDPSGDYLGARKALQDSLSGDSFGQAYKLAQDQMMPSTLEAIRTGGAALQNSFGANGLRFSTDVMGAQRRFADTQMNALGDRAAANAQGLYQTRANTALGTYGQANDMINAQLARQLPLLLQYASQFPSIGSFGTGSNRGTGFNFGVGSDITKLWGA